jgi:hypothetical protein
VDDRVDGAMLGPGVRQDLVERVRLGHVAVPIGHAVAVELRGELVPLLVVDVHGHDGVPTLSEGPHKRFTEEPTAAGNENGHHERIRT